MLADDELDFEYDLAELEDLEDLEDFDASGLTAEELEKQLEIDLNIDLEPITEDSFSKVTPTKEDPKSEPQEIKSGSKAKEDKKAEDKKTEDEKTEDKKTVQVKKDVLDNAAKQAASPKVPDQEEKKQDQPKKFDKKPIPSSLDNQHNSYKNRTFNNNNSMNYYTMQQQAMFYPQLQANIMTMNGMFPYPQQQNFNTPNRIYVNPNFKGRTHLPMMGNQSQQQPKETQHADGTKQNMSAQEELLDKQRREAAESLRRRLANRQQEGGTKRKNTDGPTNEAKRLHTAAPTNTQKRDLSVLNESKRPAAQASHAQPIPTNRGFSIRGAAAKASQKERLKEEEIKPRLSVQDRLRGVRNQEETNPKALPKPPPKPPITARLQRREQASPLSKKVENGKSSELVISNLNENITFSDIKKLVDESNAVAQITYQKGESTSTLLFGSIDAAVAFRRKYNRSKVGDSHVTIAFKK